MQQCIKIIVGLGNPGNNYSEQRHNVGFWFIDEILLQYQEKLEYKKNLLGFLGKIYLNDYAVFLFKPDLYMNESGIGVTKVLKYLNLSPAELLVVHDDIDLEVAQVRLKYGSGDGGHNGIRSIINSLHSKDFYRCRIGIGHPGHKDLVHRHVLSKPSRDDYYSISRTIKNVIATLLILLQGNLPLAMQELHKMEK